MKTARVLKGVSEMAKDKFVDHSYEYLRHLKHQPAMLKKQQNGLFITSAISQKDATQAETNVALPSQESVDDARDWVNFNKK